MNCGGKRPSSIATKPDARPNAANENATGRPINRKTTNAKNMAGAIISMAVTRPPRLAQDRLICSLLDGLFVVGIECNHAHKRCHAFDHLRDRLQNE